MLEYITLLALVSWWAERALYTWIDESSPRSPHTFTTHIFGLVVGVVVTGITYAVIGN